MVIKLRSEIASLWRTTAYCEELVAKCITSVENSTTANSNDVKELKKSLDVMARDMEDLRCAHSKENDDLEALVSRHQSAIKHGGVPLFNQITSSSDTNNELRATSQESFIRKALP